MTLSQRCLCFEIIYFVLLLYTWRTCEGTNHPTLSKELNQCFQRRNKVWNSIWEDAFNCPATLNTLVDFYVMLQSKTGMRPCSKCDCLLTHALRKQITDLNGSRVEEALIMGMNATIANDLQNLFKLFDSGSVWSIWRQAIDTATLTMSENEIAAAVIKHFSLESRVIALLMLYKKLQNRSNTDPSISGEIAKHFGDIIRDKDFKHLPWEQQAGIRSILNSLGVNTDDQMDREEPTTPKPEATIQLKLSQEKMTVTQGDSVSVTCYSVGVNQKDVVWKRADGKPFASLLTRMNGNLYSERVMPADSGEYVCQCKEGSGGLCAVNFTLHVDPKKAPKPVTRRLSKCNIHVNNPNLLCKIRYDGSCDCGSTLSLKGGSKGTSTLLSFG